MYEYIIANLYNDLHNIVIQTLVNNLQLMSENSVFFKIKKILFLAPCKVEKSSFKCAEHITLNLTKVYPFSSKLLIIILFCGSLTHLTHWHKIKKIDEN